MVTSPTKLRSSSPAPTSSTRASPTWATARVARARFERSSRKPPVDWALPSFRVRTRSSRDHWRAGAVPNSNPRRDREPQRERHDQGVEAHLVEPRDVAGYEGRHRAQHHHRRGQPEHATAHAQHDALGQELANEPPAARAEGRTQGQGPLARDAAREQQPRHVDAGDQQHEHGGHGQGQQRRPILADHLLQQRRHPRARLRLPPRGRAPAGGPHDERGGGAREEGAGLGGRLLGRDPGREAGEDAEGHQEHHARLPRSRGSRGHERRHHERCPELAVRVREVEPLGEHADDGVRFSAEVEGSPDDVGIGREAVGPGAVAQQHDPVRALARLVVGEEPAEARRRPQQGEQRR